LDIITSSAGNGFCEGCKDAFTIIDEYCDVCGRPLPCGAYCECEGNDFVFVKNRSVFVYDDVMSDVIHAFKYGNHPAHGKALGRIMARRFSSYFEQIDLIMPIPMYRQKELRRGFNQADILAGEIASYTGVKYDGKSLKRIRNTKAQSGLSDVERELNLGGAFKLTRPLAADKSILLVDDIMTTGSTMNKCAAELLRNKAAKVYGYSLSAAIKSR